MSMMDEDLNKLDEEKNGDAFFYLYNSFFF